MKIKKILDIHTTNIASTKNYHKKHFSSLQMIKCMIEYQHEGLVNAQNNDKINGSEDLHTNNQNYLTFEEESSMIQL